MSKKRCIFLENVFIVIVCYRHISHGRNHSSHISHSSHSYSHSHSPIQRVEAKCQGPWAVAAAAAVAVAAVADVAAVAMYMTNMPIAHYHLENIPKENKLFSTCNL